MAEYIDRQAAIEKIRDQGIYGSGYSNEEREDDVIGMIESIPTADVRPVVLCRDCRDSYEWSNVDGDSYRYCGYLRSRWNHDIDRMVDDDDYCKWGQKREES